MSDNTAILVSIFLLSGLLFLSSWWAIDAHSTVYKKPIPGWSFVFPITIGLVMGTAFARLIAIAF